MRIRKNQRVAELFTVGLLASVGLFAACGDDEPVSPGPQGGAAGEATGPGGESGSGGDGQAGTPVTGKGGEGGQPPTGGAAGADNVEGGAGPSIFVPYPAVPYPPENPDSEAKRILGKILFWDEQFGSDGTVTCGTCHRTGAGGSDPRAVSPTSRHPGPDAVLNTDDDVHGSLGVVRCTPEAAGASPTPIPVTRIGDPVFGMEPQVTGRRVPTYLDAMFSLELFWDGRARSTFIDPDVPGTPAIAGGGALENQALGPPLADSEMACQGRTWNDVRLRLEAVTPLALALDVPADMEDAVAGADNSYPKLFEAAFGTPEINAKRIVFAIATHERHLTSNQTPWDLYNAGDESALTPAQVRGLELFVGKAECSVCHIPPLFMDREFHNLGFINSNYDHGRQQIEPQETKGAVKTPTLRNVGLREDQGLFHYGFDPISMGADGHANLERVMAAYNTPPTPEPEDEDAIKPLNLTTDEIRDIVDFMRNGLTDPRVRDELPPFDRPKLNTEQ